MTMMTWLMVIQDAAYTHVLYRYKDKNEWQIQMDVDEYPVHLKDKESGFLTRWLKEKKKPDPQAVTQYHVSDRHV